MKQKLCSKDTPCCATALPHWSHSISWYLAQSYRNSYHSVSVIVVLIYFFSFSFSFAVFFRVSFSFSSYLLVLVLASWGSRPTDEMTV